ncbi:CBASS cGAMP synthase [Pedobacter sp. MC2016-15]|jgi:hypothetical protein|uniref:CBASS cGAMP synthase n=1 Tax=Pedobacter sp. MC2016-15 TaxID=2994473 RepID=UPI0022474A14|nr:CBASS cGAMP synthase [Pedobacter sp. MC2016-15]MCX2479369.1 CBASS cGAMP synthase [Pedobacter sp. MC2016-15]
MANCNKLFNQYQQEIALPAGKKNRMITSKDALRSRIRKYFEENHPEYEPFFYIQGSYKMGTVIRTKDDICDLDDGVYFFRKPGINAETLQGWVWDAVNGYTSNPPEHRKKCIRQPFVNDYEIDYPCYCKEENKEYQIAVKNSEYENSDPKSMVKWFNKEKDSRGILVRVVKDLKGWCDNLRNKMPSGLAMTILAANAKSMIVLNEREDISLRDILKEIKKQLNIKFECIVPAVPNDDLFENYDESRRKNFLDSLDRFINDADQALQEKNQLAASKLWRKHLGSRFPLGEDKNEEGDATSTAIAAGAATSRPWGDE